MRSFTLSEASCYAVQLASQKISEGFAELQTNRRVGAQPVLQPQTPTQTRFKPKPKIFFQKSISKIRLEGPYICLGAYNRLQSAGGKYMYVPVPSCKGLLVSRAFPKSVVI